MTNYVRCLSGPRSHPSGRALLHGLVGIAASIAIAGCGPDPDQINCINIATGERLYDAKLLEPEYAAYGFAALDTQGFTRNVNKAQAPWWKCRKEARNGH